MNKNELERRVRTWYSAEIVDGPAAPLSLRAAVDAIPSELPSARRPSRRRFLLLAAALVTVGMGGALAVGSSIFRTSTVQPNPPPPIVAVVSPSPDASVEASPVPAPNASPAEPVVAPSFEPGFRTVGDMTAARFQHTATLLDDGRVLIAGGSSVADRFLGTTEFWDPATEQFTSGPSLAVSRFGHKATRLADGRVVIIGGYVGAGRDLLGTRQVELWDPATATFRAAGRTLVPRNGSLSTVLLADGRVLIIGGADCDVPPDPNVSGFEARQACRRNALETEIWDPATESSIPDRPAPGGEGLGRGHVAGRRSRVRPWQRRPADHRRGSLEPGHGSLVSRRQSGERPTRWRDRHPPARRARPHRRRADGHAQRRTGPAAPQES